MNILDIIRYFTAILVIITGTLHSGVKALDKMVSSKEAQNLVDKANDDFYKGINELEREYNRVSDGKMEISEPKFLQMSTGYSEIETT